jgi:aquaporin TIP
MRAFIAEFLGTFALTFFGAGAICADALIRGSAAFGAADLVLIALAHAMVLATMVSALGHISGAHFNPAVTLAAAIGGKVGTAKGIGYWISQFAGAIAAAALLRAFFSSAVVGAAKLGAPQLGNGVSLGQGLLLEAVLTFFLVLVVYATAIDPRGAFGKIAGLPIGFVLFFDILMGGPLTGAAMNPARAFGPTLLGPGADSTHFAVYWLGPVAGAVVAALLYKWVFLKEGPEAA